MLSNKRAMLGNVIGAFVILLIGLSLLPSIIEQVNLATLTGNEYTIIKFVPWLFGLGIVFIAMAMVYNAFRSHKEEEDFDYDNENEDENGEKQEQKKIKYHSTIITTNTNKNTNKKKDEKINIDANTNKYIDKIDLPKSIKEANFNKTKFD
jgi:uncharacterized membrane protein